MDESVAKPPVKPLGYCPQLDGLRAFAVLGVLITHFWVDIGAGTLGVRLFFILSGFLITSILLAQKDAEEPLSYKLRTFFARRILRIWPIYYVVLIGAYLLDLGGIRPSILWHLGQVSNFYYLLRGDWNPWVAAHLWTLSVEEQFYLVWPFAVLLLAFGRFKLLLVAIIVLATIARAIGPLINPDLASLLFEVATPFDALAIGAAIAAARQAGLGLERLRAMLAPIALGAFIALLAVELLPVPALADALQVTLFGVLFAYGIVGASVGFGGIAGKVFGNPAVVYLGRISYGIYLLHLFVAAVMFKLVERLGGSLEMQGPTTFVTMSVATVMAAMLSWHFFERPINALKRIFPYRAKVSVNASTKPEGSSI